MQSIEVMDGVPAYDPGMMVAGFCKVCSWRVVACPTGSQTSDPCLRAERLRALCYGKCGPGA